MITRAGRSRGRLKRAFPPASHPAPATGRGGLGLGAVGEKTRGYMPPPSSSA